MWQRSKSTIIVNKQCCSNPRLCWAWTPTGGLSSRSDSRACLCVCRWIFAERVLKYRWCECLQRYHLSNSDPVSSGVFNSLSAPPRSLSSCPLHSDLEANGWFMQTAVSSVTYPQQLHLFMWSVPTRYTKLSVSDVFQLRFPAKPSTDS